MFYLKWIFLFNLFIFSGVSVATGDSTESKYFEQGKPDSAAVLSDLENEIFSLLSKKESDFYPAVVKLIEADQSSSGTGFFITSEILATARHVAIEGLLYFRDPLTGEKVFTEVLEFDDKYDLALLKAINYESEDFYSIGPLDGETDDDRMGVKAEPSEEDTVTVIGFPHGSFRIVEGDIMMTESDEARGFIFKFVKIDGTAPNHKGMSGGPVFFKDRELIGVHATGRRIGAGIQRRRPRGIFRIGFVPVRHLRNLVKRVGNGEMLTTTE